MTWIGLLPFEDSNSTFTPISMSDSFTFLTRSLSWCTILSASGAFCCTSRASCAYSSLSPVSALNIAACAAAAAAAAAVALSLAACAATRFFPLLINDKILCVRDDNAAAADKIQNNLENGLKHIVSLCAHRVCFSPTNRRITLVGVLPGPLQNFSTSTPPQNLSRDSFLIGRCLRSVASRTTMRSTAGGRFLPVVANQRMPSKRSLMSSLQRTGTVTTTASELS